MPGRATCTCTSSSLSCFICRRASAPCTSETWLSTFPSSPVHSQALVAAVSLSFARLTLSFDILAPSVARFLSNLLSLQCSSKFSDKMVTSELSLVLENPPWFSIKHSSVGLKSFSSLRVAALSPESLLLDTVPSWRPRPLLRIPRY